MNLRSLVPFGRDRGAVSRPEPYHFTSLQREIDRLFEEFGRGFGFAGPAGLVPSMDVAETEKEIEITAELPGLERKDVEISLSDDVLVIRGEKRSESTEDKSKDYRITERSYGSFYRSIELPRGVDPKAIKASMDHGVLKVTLPKPARSEATKIEIRSAA